MDRPAPGDGGDGGKPAWWRDWTVLTFLVTAAPLAWEVISAIARALRGLTG